MVVDECFKIEALKRGLPPITSSSKPLRFPQISLKLKSWQNRGVNRVFRIGIRCTYIRLAHPTSVVLSVRSQRSLNVRSPDIGGVVSALRALPRRQTKGAQPQPTPAGEESRPSSRPSSRVPALPE